MSNSATQKTHPDRGLVARYGEAIVSRTIATIPALVLRWQHRLGLKDEHVVTIANIFSFYSSPPQWPSVSIDKMAEWRGIGWKTVAQTVKDLERLGYLTRPGRDPKHGRSYFFDLSPLLLRLENLAVAETEMARLRQQQRRVQEAALAGLSTGTTTNREQAQRTGTENPSEEDARENGTEDRVTQDSNRVLVQGKETTGLQLSATAGPDDRCRQRSKIHPPPTVENSPPHASSPFVERRPAERSLPRSR